MTPESSETSKVATEQLMLEAILDGGSWGEYLSALPPERGLRTLAIATSAAVFRKWPEDPSLETIVDYVSEIDRRYTGELPVARVEIESVIRGIFGEPGLIDGTSSKVVVGAQLLIIRSIGFDVLSSATERNAYLAEVLEAVD